VTSFWRQFPSSRPQGPPFQFVHCSQHRPTHHTFLQTSFDPSVLFVHPLPPELLRDFLGPFLFLHIFSLLPLFSCAPTPHPSHSKDIPLVLASASLYNRAVDASLPIPSQQPSRVLSAVTKHPNDALESSARHNESTPITATAPAGRP